MKTIDIKSMQREDLSHVVDIERRVFPDPWSASMFAEQLDLPDVYSLVSARIEDELIGYAGLLMIRDEGHITNLAIKPEYQSQGVGKALIYFLFLLAQKEAIRSMTLEVRTNNFKAQKLYKHFDFKDISVRKNYYGYEEDAIIMAIEDITNSFYQRKIEEIRKNLKLHIKDDVNLAS